ncbi:MAG: hypothetical protein JWN04_1400 [Myxococcaceae bacterium]|nr:hypothetical protein [Myxococcaceae bacterium]
MTGSLDDGSDPSTSGSEDSGVHSSTSGRDAGSSASRHADASTGNGSTGNGGAGGKHDAAVGDVNNNGGGNPGTHDAGTTVVDAGHTTGGTKDAGSGGGTSTCDTLTYASFGQAFLSKYCTSCHGGVAVQGGFISLDSPQGIQAQAAKAKSAVANGSMPRSGAKPSFTEKTQFGQWIDCGAK